MRMVICYENATSDLPQFLCDGAVKWDEGASIPITKGAHKYELDDIVGAATDLRREDDGAITAEIPPEILAMSSEVKQWENDVCTLTDFSLTISGNRVSLLGDSKENPIKSAYLVVESIQLREIFIDTKVPW